MRHHESSRAPLRLIPNSNFSASRQTRVPVISNLLPSLSNRQATAVTIRAVVVNGYTIVPVIYWQTNYDWNSLWALCPVFEHGEKHDMVARTEVWLFTVSSNALLRSKRLQWIYPDFYQNLLYETDCSFVLVASPLSYLLSTAHGTSFWKFFSARWPCTLVLEFDFFVVWTWLTFLVVDIMDQKDGAEKLPPAHVEKTTVDMHAQNSLLVKELKLAQTHILQVSLFSNRGRIQSSRARNSCNISCRGAT